MRKTIAVIGTGMVGKALSAGLFKHGYPVVVGSRTREKAEVVRAQVADKLGAATFAEAARSAELIVLAVKGTAAEEVLNACGPENLAGKVVIDATNPIADSPPVNGVLQYFTGPNDSLMERLQRALPQARLVKAWSCVGSAFMVDPSFPQGRPTMFIAGNDADAKRTVTALLDEVGWDTEDMGGAEAARAIEPLAQLWCIPGLREGRWSHAFKLLHS